MVNFTPVASDHTNHVVRVTRESNLFQLIKGILRAGVGMWEELTHKRQLA